MKSTLLNKIRQSSSFIVCLVFLLASASCSKTEDVRLSDENGENIREEGETTISIKLQGIDESGGDAIQKQNKATLAVRSESISKDPAFHYRSGSFNVETTLAVSASFGSNETSRLVARGAANNSPNNGLRAAAPLATGIKYRVLIVDEANGTVVKNIEAVPGTDPVVAVDGGKSYSWYAFSTNESTSVPDVDGSGVIAKSSLANKDVLYAAGDISTVAGENAIEILFKHHTSKYTYKIYTSGLQADLLNSSVLTLKFRQPGETTTTAISKIGDLNVLTGVYENITEETPQLTADDFQQVGNPDDLDSEPYFQAEFYSVDQQNNAGKEVVLDANSLKLQSWGGDEQTITNPEIPVATNPAGFDGALGKHFTYISKFTLATSTVAGVEWAKGNLYYMASNSDDKKYLIRANNNYTDPAWDVEYWSWGAKTPTEPTSGGLDNFVDPCTFVYPEGTWRMPTREEFIALGSFHGQGFNNENVEGYTVGRGEAYREDIDLGFPLLGYRGFTPSGGEPTENISSGPDASISEAHYWTSTPIGPGTKQAYNYYSTRNVSGSFRHIPTSVNMTDQNNQGHTANGKSIRCVRPVQ